MYRKSIIAVLLLCLALFACSTNQTEQDASANVERTPTKTEQEASEDTERAPTQNKLYALAYVVRGIEYAENGEFERAISEYDQAIKHDPDLVGAYINRGLVYENLGDFERALTDYNKAIELDPDYAKAYFNRGNVYFNLGDFEKALADYDKAIELDPNYAKVYLNRGIVYKNLGDFENALENYDKAIEIDSENTAAYFYRGIVNYDSGNFENALADYNKAIELDPENAYGYIAERGYLYNKMGDHENALADANKLIEISPGSPGSYLSRGRVYKDMGDFDNALADFDKVIEISPEHSRAYYDRALVYIELGEKEKAILDLETALRLDLSPLDKEEAQKLLEDIGQSTFTPTPNQLSGMVLVPAGAFLMGSDVNDTLAECQIFNSDCKRSLFEAEEPPHDVYLDEFYIDVYEVTNAQYDECVLYGTCDPPGDFSSMTRANYYDDPGYADYPVIYVSWDNAQAYCEWRGGRLPTEAEWEKAARGGLQGRLYPWGDEIDGTRANFCDTNCPALFGSDDNYDDGYADTSPAGSYNPNGYGLYDMAGNVWEWVADWYDADYYDGSPYENPRGPSSGSDHVLRGGSWFDPATFLYVALRFGFYPESDFFGFRCARSP